MAKTTKAEGSVLEATRVRWISNYQFEKCHLVGHFFNKREVGNHNILPEGIRGVSFHDSKIFDQSFACDWFGLKY